MTVYLLTVALRHEEGVVVLGVFQSSDAAKAFAVDFCSDWSYDGNGVSTSISRNSIKYFYTITEMEVQS